MNSFDLRQWPFFISAGGDSTAPAIIDQVVIDSRRIASQAAVFVALQGTKSDGHHYVAQAAARGARYAIVDKAWTSTIAIPGITLLRVDNTLSALQQIASTYRSTCKATMVGVTGSQGKTMLKDLLAAILSSQKRVYASPESFNSQIGVALSLFGMGNSDEIAIVEAGISLPHEMPSLATMIAPKHVILTNIGHRHTATLGDDDTIAKEKLSLAANLPPQGWLLAPHHPSITKLTPQLPQDTIWWDRDSDGLPTIRHQDGRSSLYYTITFPDGVTSCDPLHCTASYHLDLVAIAVKAAWRLGISSQSILKVLQNYRMETTRTEVWQCSQGTTIINSPYSADPQSVDIALRRLNDATAKGKRILLFGGVRSPSLFHDNDLKRIGQAILSSNIDAMALYGSQELTALTEEIKTHKPSLSIERYDSLHAALERLSKTAHHSDLVLIKGPQKQTLNEVVEAFGDDIAPNICTINLAAIEGNLETIRQRLSPKTRLMVVVKALAYGTEDVRIAHFLKTCGIDILGVSFVDEAVNLKRAGVSQDIFALNALPSEARKIVRWNIEVGVSEAGLIDALAQEATQNHAIVKVHLHVDTGMGRLGCRPEDALQLAQRIVAHPSLQLEGIMTHLSSADNPQQDTFTKEQYATFEQVVTSLKETGITARYHHAANSGAVIRHHLPICNMARVGLAIFGLHGSEEVKKAIDLKLAISLTSRIAGINNSRKGDSIGYGRSYIARRDNERIAILPLGYFDGLHRQFSGKGYVLIHGQQAPMIGHICMDYMMVDITDIPDAQIGDEALIFGYDERGHYLAPEELANSVGSVAHEIISCLGPRVKRLFIYE